MTVEGAGAPTASGTLPGRRVTLVLCTRDGTPLGALAPFDVPTPWWQDVADVVAGARTRYGVEATVLRLLQVRTRAVHLGGPVTYLAEVARAPDLSLFGVPDELGDLAADQPLRAAYARPGGPAQDLAWAGQVLAGLGIAMSAPPQQLRTWNLSAIWRLPTTAGPVWLKAVPPFLAHEGAVLQMLAARDPATVPPVLGSAPGRMLLGDVPGADQYHASGAVLGRMVRILVGIQVAVADRVAQLESLAVPDWRVGAFVPRAQALLARAGAELDLAQRRVLDGLVASLPARCGEVASYGLPDSLVHGDFHPGNVRGTAERLALLDWADSGVGHPLLDQTTFCARLDAADRAEVARLWADSWTSAVPGCDPVRAAALLAPVAALRSAVVYQQFLDSIEPSERPYHADDPGRWLRRAAALAAER